MIQLRRSFVTLIVALAAIFTIQWLNSIQETTLGLESFVYFLIMLLVAVQLMLPSLRRRHAFFIMLAWIGFFLLLKLTLFRSRPLFGGIHTYITVVSTGLIALMSWLSWRCSTAMGVYEAGLRKLVLGRHGNQIHDTESAEALVHAEILRSRNFDRPLSVISFGAPAAFNPTQIAHLKAEIELAIAQKLGLEQLADLIGQRTRRTDILMLDRDSGQLVILCPETDASTAREIADQLIQFVDDKLEVQLSWGTASFPEEGLTYQSLLEQAEISAAQREQQANLRGTVSLHSKPAIQGEQ